MSLSGSNVSAQETKSSVTAYSVALGFARSIYNGHDYLFNLNEAHLTSHLCALGAKTLRGINWFLSEAVGRLSYSWQQTFFNYAVLPGYDQLLLLRKFMIKQKIEQAIAAGVKQIVILGGGYDIRALVTALNHPEIQVYEIDRGSTRECKLAGLHTIPEGIGFDDLDIIDHSQNVTVINGNMHYINADLSVEELADVLQHAGFQSQEASFFIAEGVSMYLDEDSNLRMLNAVYDLLQPQNEFLISYGTKSMYSQVSKVAQTESKELYQFLLPLENVINFANQSRLDVSEKFSAADVLNLVNDPNASYFLGHPDKAREYYFTLKKQEVVLDKDIDDVPFIQLNLPEKPVIAEKTGYCQIL